MSTRPGRETGTSIQIAVRIPKPLYARLVAAGGSQTQTVIRALDEYFARAVPAKKRKAA